MTRLGPSVFTLSAYILLIDQRSIEICKNIYRFCPWDVAYYLSKEIKWVGYHDSNSSYPCIICEEGNRFVYVVWRKRCINHHPLELLRQYSRRSRIYVWKTVRFIVFGNDQCIKSVVIPPSAEFIDKYAFNRYRNLKSVLFSGNSKFGEISFCAFEYSSIWRLKFHHQTGFL